MPWTLLSHFLSLQPRSIDTSACHGILIFEDYTFHLRTSVLSLFRLLPLLTLDCALVPSSPGCFVVSGACACCRLAHSLSQVWRHWAAHHFLSWSAVPHLLVWWSVILIIRAACFNTGLSWAQPCEKFPTVVISHPLPLKTQDLMVLNRYLIPLLGAPTPVCVQPGVSIFHSWHFVFLSSDSKRVFLQSFSYRILELLFSNYGKGQSDKALNGIQRYNSNSSYCRPVLHFLL